MFCFPSFKQISTMLPFKLFTWFLWELKPCRRRGAEQFLKRKNRNPCSHHEATSARSVHRLCNCWVSCVRSADAAKWMAMQESFFLCVFLFSRTPSMFGTVGKGGLGEKKGRGEEKQKNNLQTAIWQLECRFDVWGQLHLSAKRHSFSSTIRIDVKVLLEQLIGFLRGTKIFFLCKE